MAEEKSKTNQEAAEARLCVYETGYHLVPTLDEGGVEAATSRIRSAIEKAGGTFLAEGAAQKMALAQSIARWNNGRWIKYTDAHFGWLKFELSRSAVSDVEKALRDDKEVLRSIVFETVREDTRMNVRQFVLKEVKRTDTIKGAPRRTASAEAPAEVSEEKIDEAIAELVAD